MSFILSFSLKINNIKDLSVFNLFIKKLNSFMKESPNLIIILFLSSEFFNNFKNIFNNCFKYFLFYLIQDIYINPVLHIVFLKNIFP